MKTQTLNPSQRRVIETPAAEKVILAGPGSGKTKTLVAAIVEEIDSSHDAAGIVAITYTNKAAGEIERRISEHFEQPVRLGFCGTLHAFLLRLLVEHGQLVKLHPPLSVLDDEQRVEILLTIADEMGFKKLPTKRILECLKGSTTGTINTASKEELCALEYRNRLRSSGLLDFDMILSKGLELICRMRDFGKWPFASLFVDEFQDSADVDAAIYEQMPCERKFFVGDPNQAIYGFRGGNVTNFLRAAACAVDVSELEKRSPGDGSAPHQRVLFRLSENYRCMSAITRKANELNAGPTKTEAMRVGGKVEAHGFPSPAAEQCYLIEQMVQIDTAGLALTAVLTRTNRLANEIADALTAKGLPVAKRKWTELPHDWKKAKLMLTVMTNPFNDLAAYQFIVLHDGKTLAKEMQQAAARNMTNIMLEYSAYKKLPKAPDANFYNTMCSTFLSPESRERLHDAARRLSDRGEWTLNELLVFLNTGEETREIDGAGIYVGTIHSAKGLEWENVFICGCEEGTLPQDRKDTSLPEETRIMFVGMTRAAERLVLTYCEARPAPFGPQIMRPCLKSRFLTQLGF